MNSIDHEWQRDLRIVFIASTPRTGSTLLSTAMHRTHLLGIPREYLNLARPNYQYSEPARQLAARLHPPTPRLSRRPEVWIARKLSRGPFSAKAFTKNSWVDYLHEVAQSRSTPNGVFSIKAHWTQYRRNMLDLGLAADVWGSNITWLTTRRRNRLAQAISFYRALETGQWRPRTRLSTERGEPEYSTRGIERALKELDAQEKNWMAYFDSLGVEPLNFTFEDIVDDVERCVQTIAQSVGLHLGTRNDATDSVIRTRAPSTTADEWEERFRSQRPELILELGL